jgi:hypothetical protein
METVSFRRMDEATAEDYELLDRYEEEMLRALPDRVLEAVEALGNSSGGYKVTRKEHSLQSATRAFRDGRVRSTSWPLCCTTSATCSRRTRTARASAIAATSGSTPAPSSASATTRTASTRTTSRSRSTLSPARAAGVRGAALPRARLARDAGGPRLRGALLSRECPGERGYCSQASTLSGFCSIHSLAASSGSCLSPAMAPATCS